MYWFCCRCLLASPSADVKSLRCVAAAAVLQRWEGVWWSVRCVVGSGDFYPRYQDCKRERRGVSPAAHLRCFPKGAGHRRQPPPPRGGLIETVTNRPNYKALLKILYKSIFFCFPSLPSLDVATDERGGHVTLQVINLFYRLWLGNPSGSLLSNPLKRRSSLASPCHLSPCSRGFLGSLGMCQHKHLLLYTALLPLSRWDRCTETQQRGCFLRRNVDR